MVCHFWLAMRTPWIQFQFIAVGLEATQEHQPTMPECRNVRGEPTVIDAFFESSLTWLLPSLLQKTDGGGWPCAEQVNVVTPLTATLRSSGLTMKSGGAATKSKNAYPWFIFASRQLYKLSPRVRKRGETHITTTARRYIIQQCVELLWGAFKMWKLIPVAPQCDQRQNLWIGPKASSMQI